MNFGPNCSPEVQNAPPPAAAVAVAFRDSGLNSVSKYNFFENFTCPSQRCLRVAAVYASLLDLVRVM